MKPKWQEDSSCVFAYRFVAAFADAAIPQEKKERRNHFGADQEKRFCKKPLGRYGRKIVQGEASSRPVCRSQSAAPVIRGIAHLSDPSPGGSQDTGGAFRSRVQRPGVRGCSHEQRSKPPHRSVLTWHK